MRVRIMFRIERGAMDETQLKNEVVRDTWVQEEDRGKFQTWEKQRTGVTCKGHQTQSGVLR